MAKKTTVPNTGNCAKEEKVIVIKIEGLAELAAALSKVIEVMLAPKPVAAVAPLIKVEKNESNEVCSQEASSKEKSTSKKASRKSTSKEEVEKPEYKGMEILPIPDFTKPAAAPIAASNGAAPVDVFDFGD